MCTLRSITADYIVQERTNRDITVKHITNNITVALAEIDYLAARDNTEDASAHLYGKLNTY